MNTKEAFLSANVGLATTAKTMLMVKWIIGIAITSGVVFGVTQLVKDTNEDIPKPQPQNQWPVPEDDSVIAAEEQIMVFEQHRRIVSTATDSQTRMPDQLAQKSITPDFPEVLKMDLDTPEVITPKKEEQDTAYRFPTLTPQEQEENNKEKTRMLKLLQKTHKKRYAFVPSGKVSLNGKTKKVNAFFIQITEVTNLEYRTFLFDLLIQGRKEDFLKARPNQKMWVIEYPYAFNKPMVEHYFSHPAYNDYPVLAISREGAEMYCRWLSAELRKLGKLSRPVVNQELRLPTEEEWVYAARGGNDHAVYPWGGPYVRNAKGEFLANYMPFRGKYKADGAFHTAKVKSYPPNNFGLYDMSGNVAEMVYKSGTAGTPGTKGGSWTSIAAEIQINGPDKYAGRTDPSTNIGFRPVVTYIKR